MIWCVEDDAAIRDIEVYTLQSTALEGRGYADGDSFWEALEKEKPSLVILDVMLPGGDGVELLRRIRATAGLAELPVIMATARGTEYDKIQSLDLGADDYIVKPFGVMELVSRFKAVLRRYQQPAAVQELRMGGLVVRPDERVVTVDGVRIQLTYKEFELLRLFMARPGIAFTRDQLLSDVWGVDHVGETRTVDMHIRTLRQKLGAMGALIETVRGVGYRIAEKAPKPADGGDNEA